MATLEEELQGILGGESQSQSQPQRSRTRSPSAEQQVESAAEQQEAQEVAQDLSVELGSIIQGGQTGGEQLPEPESGPPQEVETAMRENPPEASETEGLRTPQEEESGFDVREREPRELPPLDASPQEVEQPTQIQGEPSVSDLPPMDFVGDSIRGDPADGLRVSDPGEATASNFISKLQRPTREYREKEHDFLQQAEQGFRLAGSAGENILDASGGVIKEHLLELQSGAYENLAKPFRVMSRQLDNTAIGSASGVVGSFLEARGEQREEQMEASEEYREQLWEETRDIAREDDGEVSFLEEATITAGSSTVLSIGALASAAITKGGPQSAAALMGLIEGFHTSAEQREEDANAVERINATLLAGLSEYAFESWTFGALKGPTKDTGVMQRLGEFIARDVPGELATEAIQFSAEAATIRPDATLDELGRHLAITSVATPASAGAQYGVYTGTRPAIRAVDKALWGEETLASPLGEEFQHRAAEYSDARQEQEEAEQVVRDLNETVQQANELIREQGDVETRQRADEIRSVLRDHGVEGGPVGAYLQDVGRLTSEYERVESRTSTGEIPEGGFETGRASVIRSRRAREEAEREPSEESSFLRRQMPRDEAKRYMNISENGLIEARDFLNRVMRNVDPARSRMPHVMVEVLEDSTYAADSNTRGQMVLEQLQNESTGSSEQTIRIGLSARHGNFTQNGNLSQQGYSVLAHEFGHAVFESHTLGLPSEQRQLLMEEWESRIIKNYNQPLRDVVGEFFSPQRAAEVLEVLDEHQDGGGNFTVGELIDLSRSTIEKQTPRNQWQDGSIPNPQQLERSRELGMQEARTMVEENGGNWDSVRIIESRDEAQQYERRYGPPSAVNETGQPGGQFGRSGGLYVDEDLGHGVAYAPSDVLYEDGGEQGSGRLRSRQSPFDVPYLLGSTEYMAEQVAKWGQTNETPVSEAEQLFKEAGGAVREYQEFAKNFVGEAFSTESLFRSFHGQARVDLATERLVYAKERFDEYVQQLNENPPEVVVGERVGGLINRFGKRLENKLDGDRAKEKMVRFNGFLRWTQGIINVAQSNRNLQALQKYRDITIRQNSAKNSLMVEAHEVIDEWINTLSSQENSHLEVLLFEADRRSEAKGRKLKRTEFEEIAQEYSLDVNDRVWRIANLVWSKFDDFAQRLEDQITANVRESYDMENHIEARQAMQEIEQIRKEFAQMRNRNYMPHSRFGRYWVWFKAPHDNFRFRGETFAEGETVRAEAYERKKDMEEGRDRLRKELKGRAELIFEELTDTESSFVGMPEVLMERMLGKTQAVEGITDEQAAEIRRKVKELQKEVGGPQAFKRRLENRKNTAGYSTDAMRVFSEYTWRFSNHMSRMEFAPQLEEALQEMREEKQQYSGQDRFKVSQIEGYMKRHRDYLLNPENEWAGPRSMLFHWFLGFNVKSALINFSQLPLVAYPYFSSRYGDVDAAAEMTNAMRDVSKHWNTGKGFTAEELEVFNEMRNRGIRDESNASTLAAMSGEESFMKRLTQLSKDGDMDRSGTLLKQNLGRASTFLFQKVEIFNRDVTMMAAYRMSKRAGRSHEDAMEEVYHALHMTQYEYARFNRPEMMRGKAKGLFFTFFQYMTNTAYFVYDDPGRWRYLMALFLMSGFTGLPGAQNVLDVLNFTGTAANKMLNHLGFKTMGDMRVNLEKDIEGYMNELLDNPWIENPAEFTMYGASRALSPFDLWYSLQMGRIAPTEFLTGSGSGADTAIGSAVRDSSAAGTVVYNFIQASSDLSNGQAFRAAERIMPTAARNLTKAYNQAVQGEERDSRGNLVYEFKPDSLEDKFLIAGQALSFTPNRIAKIKRDRWEAQEAVSFYQGVQSNLTAEYWKAMVKEDKEARDSALRRIKAYNKSVPWPEMKISTDTLRRSMEQRAQQDRLLRNNQYRQRKYNRLYREHVSPE